MQGPRPLSQFFWIHGCYSKFIAAFRLSRKTVVKEFVAKHSNGLTNYGFFRLSRKMSMKKFCSWKFQQLPNLMRNQHTACFQLLNLSVSLSRKSLVIVTSSGIVSVNFLEILKRTTHCESMTVYRSPLPFGRICLVVLVMRKGGESSWSGPWDIGCTSEVSFSMCTATRTTSGWAECVLFSLCLYFVCLYCFNLFVCPHPFVFPWAVESSPLQFLALA